jgi:threonine synthase
MKYYSLHKQSPVVDFKEATIRGQAPDKGLYFPEQIPHLPNALLSNMEKLSNEEIAFQMIKPYVGNTIGDEELFKIVTETIGFSIPLVPVTDSVFSLELFHGPTLAFKDVGARFMSRCLSHFAKDNNQRIVVLVATSGDTGGAVANSFYGAGNVDVVILYPSQKVSPLQEKQLTTLGKNIHTLEIEGDFDDCQQMVKQAFADAELRQQLFLTSANSINVARWLPQQFYYALAWKQWSFKNQPPVIAVPSGNFGNICAGVLAHTAGIPAKHFIAACNANDVIPAYFTTGRLQNKPAVATLSNAMDVANPSNFVRVMELFGGLPDQVKQKLSATSTDDETTRKTIKKVYANHQYVLDPHSAVAWHALENYLSGHPKEKGFIVSTAHPVKFPEIVEQEIQQPVALPAAVRGLMDKPSIKTKMEAGYHRLKEFLSEFR